MNLRKKHALFHSFQCGMTFIELAIIITIVGVFLAAGLNKGFQLMERTRLQKVQEEVHELVQAVLFFRDRYGELPGSFAQAKSAFGDKNGSGSAGITGSPLSPHTDAGKVWGHLYACGLIRKPTRKSKTGVNYPASSIGGGFSLVSNPSNDVPPGVWLVLGNETDTSTDGSLLSPRQAKVIGSVMEGSQVRAGKDAPGRCTDPMSTKKECVVYIFVCP